MNRIELEQLIQRERASNPRFAIRVCSAAGCLAAGGGEVFAALRNIAARYGLPANTVQAVGCLRLCGRGPLVCLENSRQLFERVKVTDAESILAESRGVGQATANRLDAHLPFFQMQCPVVTERFGMIEPERIESTLVAGGYQTLLRVLRDFRPTDVVENITRSGLRGRGGAGYPTGLKWATVAMAKGSEKYIICNADEGDPGAYKDRILLESDPHRVLEGMAIAGYAVGASRGFVYVRGEYSLVTDRLQIALYQARAMGMLGGQVLDTGFEFSITLRIGGSAYVCGEETALIASIEGRRGLPVPRPPYPAESGLWGQPTLINNVETLASIPPILEQGADWYASLGFGRSRGTKIFSLSGDVNHCGIIEVPMGTSLRQIVESMGGGSPNGRAIKAVQTGGPAGGCVPGDALDIPVDFEAMSSLGSIVGSGGMVVLDETRSMVELAQFFMQFSAEESCGKCVPCRAGTVQLQRILTRFVNGQADALDLQRLEELADMVQQTSLCGLGQSAPSPVQSMLRHFRNEFEARINKLQPESV